ncbi:hypothetical protein SAMN05444370_13420 [Rubrimonas cliftonensis]|uniref:Uncharacterized protein n=1 Tax=Rubrimonas cliftonensis TaxID=89524 RepID=A0A1H4G200_9RHOB|nr:hypothetical protein SAMN05444370_13420 [Rubrimonas cliftonensis]
MRLGLAKGPIRFEDILHWLPQRPEGRDDALHAAE